MTKRKLSKGFETLFGGSAFEIPAFSTGEVAEVLDVPIWRLQKFLDVKSYPLKSSGQIGGRRTFSPADVCRIKVAAHLLRDGFAPKFVVKALEFVEDEDLIGVVDGDGRVVRGGICFKRGEKGPVMGFFAYGNAPRITSNGPEYYILDLDQIAAEVDQGIRAVLEKRTNLTEAKR